MPKSSVRIVAVPIAILLTACASDKAPAETALNAAEQVVDAAMAEASRYVPDQAKALQDSLDRLKGHFNKGEYKTVLTGSADVTAKAKALTEAAAVKKAELTASWADLSGGLPRVIGAIRWRIDALGKSRSLPANLDQAAVDNARSGLESMNKVWADAQASFSAGNLVDAVSKANTVKAQAAEIMTTLGMPVPAALQS